MIGPSGGAAVEDLVGERGVRGARGRGGRRRPGHKCQRHECAGATPHGATHQPVVSNTVPVSEWLYTHRSAVWPMAVVTKLANVAPAAALTVEVAGAGPHPQAVR